MELNFRKEFFSFDRIKEFLFCTFAFLIPISQKLSTINIVVLVIVSIFGIKQKKLSFKIEFLIPIILYILYCISLLYSSELQLNIIEKKASLIAFPVIFLFNENNNKLFKPTTRFFVLGCIVALIICELLAIFNSIDFKSFTFYSRTDKEITFYDSVIKEKNRFFSFSFSFLHQAVYFSMYLLFAIFILLNKRIFKSKGIQYLTIAFLMLGVFQILNKASFIVLVILFLIKFLVGVTIKRRAIISSIIVVVVGCIIFIFNPRFKQLTKKDLFIKKENIVYKDFKDIKNIKATNTDFRVMLWVSALEIFTEHPITGIGAGGSHNRLYEIFAVKRQWYDSSEKYHAHNQYLQVLVDLGIIGFIPFFLMFLFLVKKFVESRCIIYGNILLGFILIIGINFLFESMFERYSGISFYTFFYCLFMTEKRINTPKKY